MKTKKQVLAEHPDYATLINPVIRKIGMESVKDVYEHGADAGYSGFIYTKDTVAFFKQHKKDILSLLVYAADSIEETIFEMIGSFNCLKYYDAQKKAWVESEGQEAIGKTLYSSKPDDVVANALAWFALEEVCRWFED